MTGDRDPREFMSHHPIDPMPHHDFENQVIERLTQIETTLLALVHTISAEFHDVDEEELLTSLDGEVFGGNRQEGQSLDTPIQPQGGR